MNLIDARTFNPEILYVFDPWNESTHYSDMHHHDFLEISIILEGEAAYSFENHPEINATAGTILLFNPYYRHSERQLNGSCSHQLHIGIRNIALDGLKRNFFPNQSPVLHLDKYHHFVMEKAWELVNESCGEQLEFQLMQKALVTQLLVMILRGLNARCETVPSSLNKKEQRQQKIVNYTIYYLENHHDEEVTLEKLAQDQYVSPTYLSKIFKESTGMGPINYLINIRLNRAKELLKKENLTVKEIAAMVGYQDAFHFSKSFKKHFGIAPSNLVNQENNH